MKDEHYKTTVNNHKSADTPHEENYKTEKPGETTKKSQGPKGNQIPEPDQKNFKK